MSPDAAAQFLVTTFNSRAYQVFAAVYFISIFAGPVLMGLALWRSQSVPRWLAVLFFAGLELAQQPGSIGPVPVILPFAVALVLLAAQIWQAQPPSRPAAAWSPSPCP